MSPEEERRELSFAVEGILARVVGDPAWAGSRLDRIAVLRYARLNRLGGQLVGWAQAAWLGSVLLERAGRPWSAERVVAAVRANQDLARRHVTGIGRKAQVTGWFRHLPARLATLRQRLGLGEAALFDAIEWAKCRALSDAAGADEPPALDALRDALAGTRTHYLTFLLDADCSFAVLLTADGQASVATLPVGARHLAPFADPERIAPSGRGGGGPNGFLAAGDWTESLAPLAAPLDDAVAARRIQEGDTLLVSPHGALHLFPLHELALAQQGGRAIGEVLAVARVHGAAAVLRCLAAGAPPRPQRAIALRAPLADEIADPAYAESFRRCVERLRVLLGAPADTLDAAEGSVAALLPRLGPGVVLHLACHGQMLSRGRGEERSFLVLPAGGGLATRGVGSRAPEGALTPGILLRHLEGHGAAPLRGGHVTLQACVSGHAAANPQGDAVGLEWAFLMAGTASTLGAHWNVDREDAAAFTETFYDAWLGGGSRVAAWAAAGASLRRAHGDRRWAGFSLTGEWR